jgi:hypothetical protein
MVNYPEEEAVAAVDKLLELRELMEYGDPRGRELAADALEVATRKLHREGRPTNSGTADVAFEDWRDNPLCHVGSADGSAPGRWYL